MLAASGLRDHPIDKPLVAAINGACMAADFELMPGADIRNAAAHAQFALPKARRAVLPFAGSVVRLHRQVPYAVAV